MKLDETIYAKRWRRECDEDVKKGNYLVEIISVDKFECESNSGIPCVGLNIKMVVRADIKWGYPYASKYKGAEIEDGFIYGSSADEEFFDKLDPDSYDAYSSVRRAGINKMRRLIDLVRNDRLEYFEDVVGGKFVASVKNGMLDVDASKPFRFAK